MHKKLLASFLFISGLFAIGSLSASAQSAPLAPSAVTASAPGTQSTGTTVPVTVSWTDNSDNESSFTINAFYPNGQLASFLPAGAPANATSYTFSTSTTLANIPATTTPIYFVVRAVNSYGSASSASSTQVAFVSAPLTPANFTLRYRTDGTRRQANLSWTDTLNESGYRIVKKKMQGTTVLETVNLTTPQNAVSYPDESILPGFTYSYQLSAFNSFGTSPQTIEKSISVQ